LGIFLGFFIFPPEEDNPLVPFVVQSYYFFDIIRINTRLLFLIYFSFVFTKYYALFTYAYNGLVLGIFMGWSLSLNPLLLMLIIPHGLFEIPLFLSTAIYVDKGEAYIRTHAVKYMKDFLCHLVFLVIMAGFEAFLTPRIFNSFI